MKHVTQGGTIGHIVRRIFHVSMLGFAFFYYYFLMQHVTPRILHASILIFIFFVFLFEKFRMRMRLVLFGQRPHEATHICAFAWTMLALGLVFLFSPSASFAIPIVATCALVDPLVGELRSHEINKKIVIVVGVLVALCVWCACAWFYHFPLYWAFIFGPLAVAAEWPSLKWIDDNAMMLLVPLILAVFLSGCIGSVI